MALTTPFFVVYHNNLIPKSRSVSYLFHNMWFVCTHMAYIRVEDLHGLGASFYFIYIIVVNAAFIERNNCIYLENSNIQPRGLFYKGQTKEKIFLWKSEFCKYCRVTHRIGKKKKKRIFLLPLEFFISPSNTWFAKNSFRHCIVNKLNFSGNHVKVEKRLYFFSPYFSPCVQDRG